MYFLFSVLSNIYGPDSNFPISARWNADDELIGTVKIERTPILQKQILKQKVPDSCLWNISKQNYYNMLDAVTLTQIWLFSMCVSRRLIFSCFSPLKI